jgi:SsrA-binding protein
MAEYASNSKASFNYEILETIEAGLVLKGPEVKAIKTGKASIKGAFIKMISGRPELIGATISPYQPNNTSVDYNPTASRKLLLTKKQIGVLVGFSQSQGLTLIPLKIYDTRGRLKLLIGIARGKKKYDKREALKKKDLARRKQKNLTED